MKKKPTKLTAAQKRAWLSVAELVTDMVRTIGDPEIPDETVHDPVYILSLSKRFKKESRAIYAALPFPSRAAKKTFHRRWDKMPEAIMTMLAMKTKKRDLKAAKGPPPAPVPTGLEN